MKNLGINRCLEYIIDRGELSNIDIRSYQGDKKNEFISVVSYWNPLASKHKTVTVFGVVTPTDAAFTDELFSQFKELIGKGNHFKLINAPNNFFMAGLFSLTREMDEALESGDISSFFEIFIKLTTPENAKIICGHETPKEKEKIFKEAREKFNEFNKTIN